MNKTFAALVASSALAAAAQAFTVTDVSAHQRWPWNNLVDVDFAIGDADADALFKIDVKAAYAGGDRVIAAKTFVTEPIARAGANRVTWDFGRDFPDFKADDLRVAVTATPYDNATAGVYMFIDVAGGKDATSYPVRYTTAAPSHTPKAKDACKTTEIWLKRIHPTGKWYIGERRAPAAGTDSFYYTLTHDYYIGVFETTQQQWYQMTGNWVGDFSNETWRATRPIDTGFPNMYFGKDGWKWPDTKTVPAGSVMGKMQSKTGLGTLNLPTEAQWQYAADAGATGKYYYLDPSGKEYAIADIARYAGNSGGSAVYKTGMCDADSGTACVGTYKPNAYGLYDMLGNVSEDCLDPFMQPAKIKQYYVDNGYADDGTPVQNPEGLPRATANELNGSLWITCRGNSYGGSTLTLQYRSSGRIAYTGETHPGSRGFRFCVTCE